MAMKTDEDDPGKKAFSLSDVSAHSYLHRYSLLACKNIAL